MKKLCACSLIFLLATSAGAQAPTLKEARERWLRGNYEEARALYEPLARDSKSKLAALIGISHTWQSQGEYDKALEVIAQANAANSKDADLIARHAELLYLRGRWQDAELAADQALALKPKQFL